MRPHRLLVDLIENYVNKYIGHLTLDKNDTIKELFSLASPAEIIAQIKKTISTCKTIKFYNTLYFLRDLYMSNGLSQNDRKKLMRLIEAKGIYKELNKKLYSNNFQMRDASIYTIGKLSNRKYQKYLLTAFYKYYLKKDPYLARKLIFEINWLGRDHRYELLSCLVNHSHFAFRWSALSMDNCYDFKDKRVVRLLSVLQDDPVISVRKDYLSKIKNGNRATLSDYSSAEIFVANFLSFNRYKNYNLRTISQLLNYYIGNSKEFLADIKDAKGDSDAIAKVFLRIRNEIEKGS